MLFWNKVKIGEILNGFTDWHTHILPGVDDGVKTLEDSLLILEEYERLGISRVWLTPHIMEDIPNEPGDLRRRAAELKSAYKGPVELRLSAENMIDTLLSDRLAAGNLLPIGRGAARVSPEEEASGSGLLVETSFFSPPMDLDGMLHSIRRAGYFPVLAHPERYSYMTSREYEKLKSDGVLFQLNLPSLSGFYGPSAKDRAEKFLKRGWYDFAGMDLHSYKSLMHIISGTIPEKLAARLTDLKGSEVIEG